MWGRADLQLPSPGACYLLHSSVLTQSHTHTYCAPFEDCCCRDNNQRSLWKKFSEVHTRLKLSRLVGKSLSSRLCLLSIGKGHEQIWTGQTWAEWEDLVNASPLFQLSICTICWHSVQMVEKRKPNSLPQCFSIYRLPWGGSPKLRLAKTQIAWITNY